MKEGYDTEEIHITSDGNVNIEKFGKLLGIICPYMNTTINPPPGSWTNVTSRPNCTIFCPHCNIAQINEYAPYTGQGIKEYELKLTCGQGVAYKSVNYVNDFKSKETKE